MKIPLASYGRREIAGGAAVCLGAALVCLLTVPVLAFAPVLALCLLLVFFRDPRRRIKDGGPDEVTSPADGRIADIDMVDHAPFLNVRCLRIGIFMSLLNVHITRSPADGVVEYVEHFDGLHHDARTSSGRMANEHNYIGIACPDGKKLLINQVAGLIARRIVCEAREGDRLEKGAKIGMIKFGSRLEVYVPADCTPSAAVAIGDRVKAGLDIIVRTGG